MNGMTGAKDLPTLSIGERNGDVTNGQTKMPTVTNSQRLNYVAARLLWILNSNVENSNSMDLFHLCLSLARGIDYAVANTDVPVKAQELPIVLKKICRRKNDYVLQAAVMVLMISVKIACKCEWFTHNDTKELLALANEVGSAFSSQGNINNQPNLPLHTVVDVMSRFCPHIKTGQILASLEVKPGYGAYLVDFNLPKNQSLSPKEKIRLFVAQTDNVETSSCLISPSQANFLLNGKGVDKRTNAVMETGPQFPTNVTSLLKYGTNLLQVVGQFNGNYLIVIASMNIVPIPETPVLPDYVQPTVVAQDEDAEIIEGRSRISLNCPITCKRIKTPAKGKSCKHQKSFDLDNFLKLNMKTLSWRCPHCGQSTCYLDIRFDQYLAKVLKEVSENVADIIIFEDGSWKPGSEANDLVDKPSDNFQSYQNGSNPQENTNFSVITPMVLDLTEEDDETGPIIISDVDDTKPFQTNSPQNQTIDQAMDSHMEDNFWSGIYLSTCGSEAISNSMIDSQVCPILSDAVSPSSLQRELNEPRGIPTTTSMHNQFSMPNTMQLQTSELVDSIMSNEYGTFPTAMAAQVTRTPIAVQALPAQSLQNNAAQQQRARSRLNSFTPPPPPNGISTVPSSNGFNNSIGSGGSERQQQQQFSRNFTSSVQASEVVPPSFLRATQNWNYRENVSIPNRSSQQGVGLQTPNQPPSPYRHPSPSVRTPHQTIQQQQPLGVNQRPPHMSQPPITMNRTPPHLQRTQIHQAGPPPGMSHANPPHRPTHTPRLVPFHMQPVRTVPAPVQPVTTAEDLLDVSSERNWRPTGRMRGSLSGSAYSAALEQFMMQPTQPTAQATTRPLPNPTVPQMQVPVNNKNFHAPQTGNNLTNELDSVNGLDL